MKDIVSILEARHLRAMKPPEARGDIRRWSNEIKIAILWGAWLIPYLRKNINVNDMEYTDFKNAYTPTLHAKEFTKFINIPMPHIRAHLSRLYGFGYLRRPRRAHYNIGTMGKRCAFEYALIYLYYREREAPGNLLIEKPFMHPAYTLRESYEAISP